MADMTKDEIEMAYRDKAEKIRLEKIKAEDLMIERERIPSPFVYWAQTNEAVSLRIDLKNANDCEFRIHGTEIRFSTEGIGAHGFRVYKFSLELYARPQPAKDTDLRMYENRIDVVLRKRKQEWWPRLTATPQKPAWLKINFDLWKSEDGVESEEEVRDVMTDYPGMYDKLHKEEMGYRKGKEELKKVYLAIYNLFQLVGYMYVLSVMCVRYAKLGYDSVNDTYEHVGSAMKFLQLMQYLEVMHPLFGYTKGGVLVPFMQVSGRAFILFAMIEAEPRMQTKPVVFYLFLVWSAVEIVRYPFYITQIYKKEIYLLTWLRYSIWIPLYPLGILCESIVILRNIPYFEETEKFTVSLPNEYNFAFHMPSFMRVYLLILTVPGMFFVMGHMNKLRRTKLQTKIVIRKSSN